MEQSLAQFRMRRYRLQPGDGTLYEFFIVHLGVGHGIYWMRCVDTDKPLSEGGRYFRKPMDLSNVIDGVGSSGDEFVTLGICVPAQGVYEVLKSSLRDPHHQFVRYLKKKMPHVDIYSLAAVVLACQVLVDDPYNLEDAANAMLQATFLLDERELQS